MAGESLAIHWLNDDQFDVFSSYKLTNGLSCDSCIGTYKREDLGDDGMMAVVHTVRRIAKGLHIGLEIHGTQVV